MAFQTRRALVPECILEGVVRVLTPVTAPSGLCG